MSWFANYIQNLSWFARPATPKTQPKLDAHLRRRKVTTNEHDAKAILPEPRSVKSKFLSLIACLLIGLPTGVFGQTYTWSTLAGLALSAGSSDGAGSGARFNAPSGIAVDNGGVVYVADQGNNTIRKLTSNGTSSNWATVTIAGFPGISSENDGAGTNAWFRVPAGIAAAGSADLFVVDAPPSSYGMLRRITLAGGVWQTVTVKVDNSIVGSLGINTAPSGVAVNNAGDVFAVLSLANQILMATLQGQKWASWEIAGDGSGYRSGTADGTNLVARFNAPSAVGTDANGNVYVADTGNHTIRKMTPQGTNWITTTIAGQAGNFGNTDGTNTTAQFNGPSGLAVDQSGNIFVSDSSSTV